MEQIIVHGGKKLRGNVKIEGGKNVTLPILAAAILADEGATTLKNVPILSDVLVMLEILKSLNVSVDFNSENNEVAIDAAKNLRCEASSELLSKMRASVLIMGALLARNGHAKVTMPGGCAIGKRPIDLHLKGFKALGAEITIRNGYLEAFSKTLTGCDIHLDFPSVGATQNILLASVKSKGTTVISNAAQEPEVVELALFLNKMGAKITGYGTEVIRINGVNKLVGAKFSIIQDRHEVGTFMIAAAMTEGDILIEEASIVDNQALVFKLREAGATIIQEQGGIRVKGSQIINALNVTTEPHPGFPTDLQAPLSSMLATAYGVSTVTETIYENRFQHLSELSKMTADISVTDDVATINGGEIIGAKVNASDLRSAAALVLAGLTAKGKTRVTNLEYLDRGYYKFHEKLQKLGAKIERVVVKEDSFVVNKMEKTTQEVAKFIYFDQNMKSVSEFIL